MENALIAALAALLVAMFAAYVNGFVVERYKRFQDGSALAAGLAGELRSYEGAPATMREVMGAFVRMVDAGQRDRVHLPAIERPKDAFYDANVAKIGLLGPELVEDIVFVYGHIGAFRTSMGIISKDAAALSDEQFKAQCASTTWALDRAEAKALPLVQALHERAIAKFRFWG